MRDCPKKKSISQIKSRVAKNARMWQVIYRVQKTREYRSNIYWYEIIAVLFKEFIRQEYGRIVEVENWLHNDSLVKRSWSAWNFANPSINLLRISDINSAVRTMTYVVEVPIAVRLRCGCRKRTRSVVSVSVIMRYDINFRKRIAKSSTVLQALLARSQCHGRTT